MQGQVARCYAETCFQKFVSDNLQRLMGLPETDLIKEFAGLKLNLRQGFVSTGMGDLQSKMLPVLMLRSANLISLYRLGNSRSCYRQNSLQPSNVLCELSAI
jgi:hypothetical protein